MATILYFGPARERTGIDGEELSLSGTATVSELWDRLIAHRPMLAPLRDSCRVAVDQEYASGNVVIDNGSEVAIIPPVAGG
jgi:molybdopterin synthase catalytic subunit